MHDCRTLAKRLRDVLIISTAVSCSSGPGAGTTTPPPVVGNETGPDTEPWPAIGADGLPIPDPPFPHPSMCDSARWCGHPEVGLERARAQTAGTVQDDGVLGCASYFSDDDTGLYFSLDPEQTSENRTGGGAEECCYYVSTPCVDGRPLVSADAVGGAPIALLAAILAGPARATPDPLARRVGELWLASARAEHASIASFARAAIELMAVGAPLELITACQRASLDEVVHARGCLALARRHLQRDLAFGPLPSVAPRAADLRTVAVDTFVEGCVGETVATVIAQRARAGCDDPAAARLLDRIVRDEARHAELAWRTVAWAVAHGGAPVAEALRAVARTAAAMPPPAGAADPRLAAHGRLDDVGLAAAIDDAWREIVTPTLTMILSA